MAGGEPFVHFIGGAQFDFYDPLNPALTAILNGNQMRAISLGHAVRAKDIYAAIVAKSSRVYDQHLFQVVKATTEKTFTSYGPRWSGIMEVVSDHIIPHELGWTDPRTNIHYEGAHDLNAVLEAL